MLLLVEVGDHQALLALRVLAERDRARDLREDARVLRRTRLEELGHARQTAGDVPRLRHLLRDPRQHVAHLHLLAVAHGDHRAHREADVHGVVGAGDAYFLARLVDELHGRPLALARRRRAPLGVDDDEGREARDVVDLLGDGRALLDVLELHRAGVLGDDGPVVGIPVGERLARADRIAVGNREERAVRHLVALTLAAVVVGDDHLARARDDDLLGLRVRQIAHGRGEAHRASRFCLDVALHRGPRGSAADVERAHGELRAGLADRLRGDHADRLADVDQRPAAEVAPVALGAHAPSGFTGQRGAHLHLVDADVVDHLDRLLVEQRACRIQHILRFRVQQVVRQHAAEDALLQRLHHLAAFDERLHGEAVLRAAIVLGDHQVLRDVDQAPREIAGIGRLQRGVGEALPRAVRRDEVLQHVQAFAEVRRDRRLDDRAVGLRHQAAHAGELSDLRRRAPRS